MDINDWIEGTHLSAAATLVYGQAIHGGDRRAAVLDGFLKPGKLAALRKNFSGDGLFTMVYGLAGRHPHEVPAEEYAAAEPANHFYRFRSLTGPAPGHHLSPGYLAHLLFSTLTLTPGWLAWLSAIIGEKLTVRTGMHARIMTRDMIIAPHSDRGHGAICAVLYLSDGWSSAFGGTFVQDHEGERVTEVEPLENRLLLFSPARGAAHGVAPFSPAMGDWERWSYSLWYGTKDDAGEAH
jgi:hypothetical protein